MNIIKRLEKLESSNGKKQSALLPVLKRPRPSREEWLRIVELEQGGMDDIAARKLVYSDRDDGGL
jgi:hypothetical protein